MSLKLIFLDLDGVLVTRRPGVIEETLLKNLAYIVERTGSLIVLSSDWRRHPQARAEARRVLRTAGLDFIGHTPCMSAFIAQRPTEILQWKKEFSQRENAPKITHWVAIDDRMLVEERHGSYLRGHFVQTQLMRGLTEAHAEAVIRILNADVPEGEEEAQPIETLEPRGAAALGGTGAVRGASVGRIAGPTRGFALKSSTAPAGPSRGRSHSPGMLGRGRR